MLTEEKKPIVRACHLLGGQIKLARALGVTPQAVNLWVRTGRVPPERVLAVEELTGGAVTRYDLRPDVFGETPATPQQTAQEAA